MIWKSNVKSFLSPLQEMPHQMTSNPATNDPLITFLLLIISLLLILVIVLAVIFLYRYIRDQKQKEDLKDKQDESADKKDTRTFTRPSHWEILSLEEQAVIDLLIQNEGNLLQRDVPFQTNFSKSTVTRILSRLEDQDIVYRSPAGRGYRIFLKELEAL